MRRAVGKVSFFLFGGKSAHFQRHRAFPGVDERAHDHRRDQRQEGLGAGQQTALGFQAAAALGIGDGVHRAGHLGHDLEHRGDDVAHPAGETALFQFLDQLGGLGREHQNRKGEQHVQNVAADVQRIQQTLAVKVQRSDAEQDVAVALVEQAMDQKDGDQDREGEGYQRNHPLEQPAAGQHRQTEGDEDGKKGQLAHQQRHTDGRGNVRQLGKGMNLAQPAAVIHIKTDTFHLNHSIRICFHFLV